MVGSLAQMERLRERNERGKSRGLQIGAMRVVFFNGDVNLTDEDNQGAPVAQYIEFPSPLFVIANSLFSITNPTKIEQ